MRVLAVMLLPACLATAQLAGPGAGEPCARVLRELLDDFPAAQVRNAASASVNRLARAEALVMPALALHPQAEGDAVVAFANVQVPVCSGGRRALLLVHLGLSDGIPWRDSRRPNGVRFTVAAQDTVLIEQALNETTWQARIADLTPWAGTAVSLEFRTNAIAGNTAFDWALFGRPRLIEFLAEPEPFSPALGAAGLALLEFRLERPATVTVAVGADRTRATLPAGSHLLPALYSSWAPPEIQAEPGPAVLAAVRRAPFAYAAEVTGLVPATAFATAGRPIDIRLTLHNLSLGTVPAGAELRLRASVPAGAPAAGPVADLAAPLPALAPGAVGAVCWPGFAVAGPGDLTLSVAAGTPVAAATLHVYPAEPALPLDRPRRARVRLHEDGGRWAVAENPWCRVAVVLEADRDGYGLAEVWAGSGWQRTASLFPLLRVVVASGPDGQREELRVCLSEARTSRGRLLLAGHAVSADGTAWPVRWSLEPAADAPRLRLTGELEAPAAGGRLLAFAAATVLPGDRAYGVAKDFALFPGLEYLEGSEASSSPRDLAPPLHDRRVPAPLKIACPVMAVQGGDALTALLWDPQQEWAPGQRLPAARFLCPESAVGLQYNHFSLFAPGVGELVPENAAEATRPADLAPGQTVRLEAWLVLDPASRYPADSVVRGPHRGGLITQAVRHWFDVFGLPAPAAPPRSWPEQCTLSREPYLGTLWQADPPGWALTVGEAPRANPALTAPLLLDLQQGLPEGLLGEVPPRLDRVLGRSLAEDGMVVPVHGNSPLLQYQFGYVAEALQAGADNARGLLSSRQDGTWVWQPDDAEHARLGIAGTHTLGQAAYPCLLAVRAALYSGDPELARVALAALRQMEPYEIPRGASMWECPQFQPDLFAAALAIRAYCAAYRLSADPAYLAQARYWAWTGLPFVYTWTLPGYPTMLYNSVGVVGSTFFTHSWIGRPVVWMGLDYAYALQDLAGFDSSFDWRRVAEGITTSAMWQQYTEGPSRGCYPDSWEMASNRPNPVDINPILIQLNAFRLRGQSLDVRTIRLAGSAGWVSLCAGADIAAVRGAPAEGQLEYRLAPPPATPVYASLAQVPRPTAVAGAGEACADSAALAARSQGWLYHEPTRCIVVKHSPEAGQRWVTLRW
jgi:hypothetical protein